MTDDRNARFYERMLLIREFDNLAQGLFRQGKLFGTTHASTGQEAVAVGVATHLDRQRDVVVSNHRSHAHYLAFTGDTAGLLAELMGRQTGVSRGWGGSQHLHGPGFYSNGVLGNMIPVAVGMAYAEKVQETGALVCPFLGDGTLGQGVVYESLNMAALWDLPVLFCVENNGYQQATPTAKALAGDIEARGRAFGLTTHRVDGNDVLAVADLLSTVVPAVRRGQPHFVVFDTYRLGGHSKSDDCCYRDPAEEDQWRQQDPLTRLAQNLSRAALEAAATQAENALKTALEAAEAAPPASETRP